MLWMIVKVYVSIIINSGRIIFSVNTVKTQSTTDKKGENKRHFWRKRLYLFVNLASNFECFYLHKMGTSNRQIGKYTEVNVRKLNFPNETLVKFYFDFYRASVVLVVFLQHCIILVVLAVDYHFVLILVV